MPTVKPRIMVTFSEDEHKKILDYQHQNRIPSTSKALLALIEQGLNILEAETEEAKRVEIAAISNTEISHDEAELVAAYRKLNADGRQMAVGMVESLTLNPAYTKDTSSAVG